MQQLHDGRIEQLPSAYLAETRESVTTAIEELIEVGARIRPLYVGTEQMGWVRGVLRALPDHQGRNSLRAITWVNGADLRKLEGSGRLVVAPRTKQRRDFQTVMRDTILGWGGEVMQLLWKALMVHVQKIEDRLFESLPEAAVMTDVERKYLDRLQKEIEAQTQDVLRDRIEQLVDGDGTEDAPEVPTAS
jgi:hypothetical protein